MAGKSYEESLNHYWKIYLTLVGLLAVSIVGPEVGAVTGVAVSGAGVRGGSGGLPPCDSVIAVGAGGARGESFITPTPTAWR